ncbi:hypothetical protein [Mucilaginibacter paludis]|uniref:Uncharacterized protein n=1 Tax=Mucilaginibacter paludis DSM 18603 TaxID=714943 RepID=H1Y554_9SPHI|nr:hypothetical protein [Mucilaginibacter paludis]EHQ28597.1 hypothetical protein Mucpa_4507 [Mucilaginibacter paludis DSM 18603]
MYKSATALFLAMFFLAGSTLLPLGDFSLMTDLPNMYRGYTKIVKEEPDVIDFIGDYLFNGKEILGHNRRDAPQKPDSAIQFQHQANCLNIILIQLYLPALSIADAFKKHIVSQQLLHTSDYQNELFRPPLV